MIKIMKLIRKGLPYAAALGMSALMIMLFGLVVMFMFSLQIGIVCLLQMYRIAPYIGLGLIIWIAVSTYLHERE